ncbi:MAG: BLUF domain-containing protein [Ginsengibacter sp.]
MNYLVYVSSACKHFSEEDLKTLLMKSRENNIKLGITGMLLYSENNFIQVIEGELASINGLYSNITNDPRHTGFLTLLRGEIQARNFPDWSMGFKKISENDYSVISGFENLDGSSSLAINNLRERRIMGLLKNFLKINSIGARYA